MVVGICKLDIHLLEAPHSLKEKRQIVRRIKERIRNNFEVSVAEVDENDLWQRAVIGVSCVSKDQVHANSILSKIIDKVESDPAIELIDCLMKFEVI